MILVFRVPFRDLGDFWDPEMQAPAGPRPAIWERPEIPIVSLLSGGAEIALGLRDRSRSRHNKQSMTNS